MGHKDILQLDTHILFGVMSPVNLKNSCSDQEVLELWPSPPQKKSFYAKLELWANFGPNI